MGARSLHRVTRAAALALQRGFQAPHASAPSHPRDTVLVPRRQGRAPGARAQPVAPRSSRAESAWIGFAQASLPERRCGVKSLADDRALASTSRSEPNLGARVDSAPLCAFAEHVDWLRSRLRRPALRGGLDLHDIEDAIQETWIQAWIRGAESRSRGWFLAVAWNRCRRALRQRRARRSVECGDERTDLSALDPSTFGPDDTGGVGEPLARALLGLDVYQRQIVELHFFEGLSVLEVARRSGSSRKRVRGALTRALRSMRFSVRECGARD
jgi:RNA polymerase sigma-70 factor (ECF subfamily)